jgi:hypothetical protein
MKKGLLLLGGFLAAAGSAISAQEPGIEEADLPRWVEEDIINFFNDPTTIHFTGRARIPVTRVVVGDVASLGGPFTIAGEVEGDLVVVNGDLVFEAGGSVAGDVMIVGGTVIGQELGAIGGNLTVFEEPLRYVQRGERIAPAGRPSDREGFGPDFPWGDARFTIKSGQNYNRTEGLPVMFGPSFRTAGANPLRLDFLGIWRTDTGFELNQDDFGYALRAEQALGGRNNLAVGATLFSLVAPVEDWGLSNLEASLSTFFLHKDYRDYYERTGWSAYATFRFPYTPISLRAEYFREDHEFMPVASPWSFTKNNEPWRPQPLVAQGDVQFLEGSLNIDTRNDPGDPSDGWLVQARFRRGITGSLELPSHLESPEGPPETVEAQPFDTDFFTGFVDARAYLRINPGASLNLRGVGGGALNDVPVPPQYQHTIGGVGSLPGQRLFEGDCGARELRRAYEYDTDGGLVQSEVFSSYGCQRFVLFQAEFRGRLFWDWGLGWDDPSDPWEDDWTWYPEIDFSPNWAAFFNAGRAWTLEDDDTETLMDAGIGILFGDVGVYFAYPITEDEDGKREVKFFLRLNRRF